MNYELNRALQLIKEAQVTIIKASEDAEASKEVFKLSELSDCVDAFCKRSQSSKGDICLIADISHSTLTAALRNPEKATMTTILAITSVVGIEVLLGRRNG